MARPKKVSNKTDIPEEEVDEKSMIQGTESHEKTSDSEKTEPPVSEEALDATDNESAIRILYRNNCQKLTTRGVGELQYEIGFIDTLDEAYLRITGNESSGAFSTKWIALSDIQTTIDKVEEETFRSVILRDLYFRKSANNHGYLGSVLKAEKVVAALPNQPTVLRLESWEPLLKKIETLKEQGVSLPDTLAKAEKESNKKQS